MIKSTQRQLDASLPSYQKDLVAYRTVDEQEQPVNSTPWSTSRRLWTFLVLGGLALLGTFALTNTSGSRSVAWHSVSPMSAEPGHLTGELMGELWGKSKEDSKSKKEKEEKKEEEKKEKTEEKEKSKKKKEKAEKKKEEMRVKAEKKKEKAEKKKKEEKKGGEKESQRRRKSQQNNRID